MHTTETNRERETEIQRFRDSGETHRAIDRERKTAQTITIQKVTEIYIER